MRPRNTLLLLLVAALLGGLVYWLEGPRATAKKDAEAAAKRLFSGVEAGAIEWIALRSTDGRDVEVERRDGAWKLAKPLVDDGDPVSLDAMATALAEVSSETVIESAQGAEVYGLADAARVVRFRAGGSERALRIGKRAPIGASTYARAGDDGAIVTVPTYRTSPFERKLDDLRERRVLRFDRNAIEGVRVRWPEGEVALEQKERVWHMGAPIAGLADDVTTDKLLSDAGFLRAEGFLDGATSDAELGLDRPELRIELRDRAPEAGGEAKTHLLEIGRPLASDAKLRAARAGGRVVTIATERLADYPRQVVAYRFKEVSRFVATDAQRFEVTLHDPASSAPVVASVVKKDEGWTIEGGGTLVSGKPTRLVSELSRLRAKDILSDAVSDAEKPKLGLAPPAARIRVFGTKTAQDEPLLVEVEIGRNDAEKGFVAKNVATDAVYLVDASLAEHLPIDLATWREKFLAKETPKPAGAAAAPGAAAPPTLPTASEDEGNPAAAEDVFPPGAAETGMPKP